MDRSRHCFIILLAMGISFSVDCGGGGENGEDAAEDTARDVIHEDIVYDPDMTGDPDMMELPTDLPAEEVVAPDLPLDDGGGEPPGPGELIGDVDLTYYWVAYEGDYSCDAPDTVIGTCSGETIATVCLDFAEAARLEGTARLTDERIINIGGCSCSGGFNCFMLLDTETYPWGMGNRSNPLELFISVAADQDLIPYGTILYSPQIDGVELPEEAGGGVHDGCMRVDDVGGGISDMHIDFFAGLRDYYTDLNPKIAETITLYKDPPRCSL